MDIPKVSVVIPVYNVAAFLPACIESCLSQTFQEIEFIFVNDASTDNSAQILHTYEERYPEKIRVIDLPQNRKQGGARNAGIRASRAEYIGFIDSDDMVSPDMYRQLYEKAIATDADVVYIQYTRVAEDASLEQLNKNRPALAPIFDWKELRRWDNTPLTDQGRMDLMTYPIGGVYCGLYKKSLIADNGTFFPEGLRYEDNYWGTLLKCYLTKVAFLPEVHYYYRTRHTSTINTRNAAYTFDRIKLEQLLLHDVKEHGFFERYHDAWEYIYIFRYAFNTIDIFLHMFDRPPFKTIHAILQDLNKTFPNWTNNRYYQEMTSDETKKIHQEICASPERYWAKLYMIPRVKHYLGFPKRCVKKLFSVFR